MYLLVHGCLAWKDSFQVVIPPRSCNLLIATIPESWYTQDNKYPPPPPPPHTHTHTHTLLILFTMASAIRQQYYTSKNIANK